MGKLVLMHKNIIDSLKIAINNQVIVESNNEDLIVINFENDLSNLKFYALLEAVKILEIDHEMKNLEGKKTLLLINPCTNLNLEKLKFEFNESYQANLNDYRSNSFPNDTSTTIPNKWVNYIRSNNEQKNSKKYSYDI